MKLYADKPHSKGVENALKRARQMVELKWTPQKMLASGHIFNTPTGKKYLDTWIPAHMPQQGVIYSSPRAHRKFVGTNVSIETYMTAMANPNSVLYTRPQHGVARSAFSYYGIVCSAFVSYVCGLPQFVACAGWPKVPGAELIELNALEELRLGDILWGYNPPDLGHITIITEILRDVEGNVHQISVSESTTPCCCCTAFTPEEFRGYWLEGGYRVIRYAGIHDVTYTPNPYVPLEGDPYMPAPVYNSAFMADYGDKANYNLGETVEFSIFEEGWEAIEIAGPDGLAVSLPITGSTVTYTPEVSGAYSAVCRKGDEVSQAVSFCSVFVEIVPEKATFAVGEPIRGVFRTGNPEDKVFNVNVSTGDLFFRLSRSTTQKEQAEQCVEITDTLAPGTYVFVLSAQGEYGVYSTNSSVFTVE